LAIARQIVGPQEQYERSGAQSLRDIRPLTTRLAEGLRSSASGLVLGIAAAATFLEPAIVDLALPASALYALWVLTRRVKLPMRLPRSAACPDYSNPTPSSPPQARERNALHRMEHHGCELWAAAGGARQHIAIPGDGASKTARF
jgi:intracellular multiplication protein IcmO